MAYLILPHEWVRQPGAAFGIDWSNPITRGLCFLVNYADPAARNLVTGELPNLVGAGRTVAGVRDGVAQHSASGEYLYEWDSLASTSTGDGNGGITLLSYSVPTAEASKSCLLSSSDGLGQPQVYILANTGAGYGASSGDLTFGAIGGIVPAISGYIDGKPHVYLYGRISYNETGECYVDGVKRQDFSNVTGGAWSSAATARIRASGINGYTSWTRPHPHLVQAIWNRNLSSAEKVEVTRNPWQLFQPIQRRIYVGPSAGASMTVLVPSRSHTYTAATPKLNARTTAGQVTHTYTARAPQVRARVAPGAVAHSYTGRAPQVRARVAVPVRGHTYTVAPPALLTGAAVGVPVRAHSYTAQAPKVSPRVAVPARSHSYTARVPTALAGNSIGAPVAAHSYLGRAPSLLAAGSVAAPRLQHSYAAIAPAVRAGAMVAVPSRAHTYTARAPQVRSAVRAPAALHTYLGQPASVGSAGSVFAPVAVHGYTAPVPVVTSVLFVSAGGGRGRIGSAAAADGSQRLGGSTAGRSETGRIGSENG